MESIKFMNKMRAYSKIDYAFMLISKLHAYNKFKTKYINLNKSINHILFSIHNINSFLPYIFQSNNIKTEKGVLF